MILIINLNFEQEYSEGDILVSDLGHSFIYIGRSRIDGNIILKPIGESNFDIYNAIQHIPGIIYDRELQVTIHHIPIGISFKKEGFIISQQKNVRWKKLRLDKVQNRYIYKK